MPQGKSALQSLFIALADTFDEEGRAGAQEAASALRIMADLIPNAPPLFPTRYAEALTQTLQTSDHPLAPLIINAIPFIPWGGSEARSGRISDTLADQMPMCELVGPEGLFKIGHVRVGLCMQQAGVVYGPRRHLAEETFVQIAGRALWSTENNTPTTHDTGAFIHHPSNVLHTSQTTDAPVFTAWRWSGDIGFDTYQLK